jgi:hypothetical protein
MAISLSQLTRASAPKPPRILIHGVAGVGKTTFAAGASHPVFIQTEDGLGTIDANHFPIARSFEEVIECLVTLYSEPHDFKTAVVDSADWLEPLIWAKTCKEYGWKDLEAPGYGKGYLATMEFWRQYLDGLNALRDERGMTIVQIAHTDIKRFDSPEHEPYDRYVIKLHARAAALLQEHADIVLFANYRISTVKADVGFNKKVNRALGSGERVIHTAERPAFLAKNRYGLPDTLPLDWSAFAQAMPNSLNAALVHPLNRPFPTQRRNTMASFGHTFDASTVDPTTPFEVLPPGQVPRAARASEMRVTKDGWGNTCSSNSTCWKARMPGASSSTACNLVNANSPDAVLMAQRSLSALCRGSRRQDAGQQQRPCRLFRFNCI